MTKVINVGVQHLRKEGYWDLLEWLKKPEHIYIGRCSGHVKGADKSFWYNPFSVKKYGRDKCLEMYKHYVMNNPEMMSKIEGLDGKTLGCWCHPEKCHGDILIEILHNLLKEKEKERVRVNKKIKNNGLKSAAEIILA
jgi:hypothetical protein